jgi:hypothetical protein
MDGQGELDIEKMVTKRTEPTPEISSQEDCDSCVI